MKKLFIKLFRDIKKSLGQFIAVTIVSAIGVALLTGFSVTYVSLKNMTDSYYRQGNLADLSAYYLGINDAGIGKIKNISGVSDAYGRITLKASAADSKSDLLIHSVSSDEKIDVPALNAGKYPQTNDECMIDSAYARANGLTVGNELSAVINGQTYHFKISGIFNTAEYIYLVEDPAKNPYPDHNAYGLLYVNKSMINTLTGSTSYNEVLITVKKNADVNAVKNAVESATGSYGFGHITGSKDQTSFSQLQSDIDTVSAISSSFPYIFFLVAAAITFISMSRTVQAERGQIGIMKALGIRPRTITMHYLSYSIICGLLGSIIGNLFGVFVIPDFMLSEYAQLYTFPSIVISGFWLYVIVSTLVVLFFGIIAGMLSARKVIREMPASCMRPAPPKKVHKIWFEKHEKLWSRISYKHKLILRNILLNKQRAVLSSIGIIGCVGVLMCGFGLKEAVSDLYNSQFSQMQRFDDMVLLSTPVAYDAPVPSDNGNITNTDKLSTIQATMNLSKDVSTVLYVLPKSNESIRLFDKNGNSLSLPSTGVVVPYKLAQEYDIKVGGTVSIKLESPLYNNAVIHARVAAIDVLYLSQDIYASYDYMQTLGVNPYVNGYYINVNDKSALTSTNAYLSSASNVRSVVSNDTLNKSISSMMGMINTFVFLMIFMSAALTLAVIFNISSINIFERRRDIATLKVLGYHKNEINSLVHVENLIITTFGCIFGVVFGAIIYKYLLIVIVSTDMYFPYKISFSMVALSILMTFVFTILTNFLLRGKTRRIDMVESLKGVE